MNGVIVVNAYIKNKSQITQAQRLAEEFAALKVDCKIIKNVGLAQIKNGGIEGMESDFVVFLDKDKAAARMLEKRGLRLFNSSAAIEVCDDKLLTHIALADNGIPMPDCVYSPLCYYPDAQIDENFIDETVKKLGLPLVAKNCYGSLGAGVFLIKDKQMLYDFERENKLKPHFYQKFIGRGGEDIRIIVIGGKFVCAMRRKNPDDFRSNIELGGKGESYTADENLIALCEKVAKILKLDYCGIDVLTDNDGGRYICEVNSNAFFAAAEKVCGVNIAKKYAEFVISCKNA